MMNVNNRDEALKLTKELQGKSVVESIDYIKRISGLFSDYTLLVYLSDAQSDNDGSFWMYILLGIEDEDMESLTDDMGLSKLGVVVTIRPTKEELCNVISEKKYDIDLNQDINRIIFDLAAVFFFSFDDINVIQEFENVVYQWEVWPTKEDFVDWNDLEEE